MADEDTKPNMESVKLNIKVKAQDGSLVVFQAKPTTAFRKLMKAYCDRQGVAMDAVRFTFEGARLREEQTCEEVGIEDQDIIDVMVNQVGGF